jgi:hypothetical protein
LPPFQTAFNIGSFEILTAVIIKIVVFWVLTPCSFVGRCQLFGGTCCPIFRVEGCRFRMFMEASLVVEPKERG